MINEYKVFFDITIFIDATLFSFVEYLNLILVRYEFFARPSGFDFRSSGNLTGSLVVGRK